jgi:hypothetical protein
MTAGNGVVKSLPYISGEKKIWVQEYKIVRKICWDGIYYCKDISTFVHPLLVT